MTTRGLLLFPRPGDHYREDFAGIADRLRRIAPDLRVKVAHEPRPPADIADGFADMPTLAVSFRHDVPVPVPGRVFHCRYVPKPVQIRRYAKAGIPFPRARLFEWGVELDPSVWGPFVVMKPIRPGTMSQGTVHLMPTDLVHRITPANFDSRHPIHSGPMLIQAFVDTGERPTSYRVLTLFGEPLYAMTHISKQPRPPLNSTAKELIEARITSSGGPRDMVLTDDPEVLAFARRMSRALPNVPLQGLDIIREHSTGQLWALESNPGGNTWHFSSRYAVKLRGEGGISREDRLRQFNALERAAEALARAVEQYAE